MISIYLDNSAIINLLKDSQKELKNFIRNMIQNNELEILVSHGQKDDGFRKNISNFPTRRVSTGCFVIGYSRKGMARLGDPEGVYEALTKDLRDRSTNHRPVWDAIHYATAHIEKVNFFISDDKKLLIKINERIANPIRAIPLCELKESLEKIR